MLPACGTGGAACTNCLTSNSLCEAGTCLPCDVCQPAGACAFSSVQAAINATTPQLSTIRVCAGTYFESGGFVGLGNLEITRSLSLIGAGDGADDTTSTIIKPAASAKAVVYVPASGVALQGLRITGGSGLNGNGLHIIFAIVSITDCTISGNTAIGQPGGMTVFDLAIDNGTHVTLTNTQITGNTGTFEGGIKVACTPHPGYAEPGDGQHLDQRLWRDSQFRRRRRFAERR